MLEEKLHGIASSSKKRVSVPVGQKDAPFFLVMSPSLFLSLAAFFLISSLSLSAEPSPLYCLSSYNIAHASQGKTQADTLEKIAQSLQTSPPKEASQEVHHLIALQELDFNTQRSQGKNLLEELQKKMSFSFAYKAHAFAFSGGFYGIGLLSPLPVKNIQQIPLASAEENRVLLVCEFEDFVLISTHLSLQSAERKQALATIALLTQKYPQKVVFLLGDLNFTPQSPEYKLLLENFTPILPEGALSYPTPKPTELLDHILVDKKHASCLEIQQASVLNKISHSDHYPVQVCFRLKKETPPPLPQKEAKS